MNGEQGLTGSDTVREQYATADKLNTRISLHDRYSVNKQGFGPWIAAHYSFPEGARVLELGCGTGSLWAGQDALIQRCSKLILTDLNEGMVEKARAALGERPGLEYRTADIQSIPFPDRSFDAVIANMMLYHVPDMEKALREVRRVLKKDGTFYAATYGENGMTAFLNGLIDMNIPVGSAFTLQNGRDKLKNYFADIVTDLYDDALIVTNAEDLADYVLSLPAAQGLKGLTKDTVRAVIEKHMTDGALRVPKEYGMFIARAPKDEEDL